MKWRNVILIVLGLSISLTAYIPKQSDFEIIILFYGIAFGAYTLMFRYLNVLNHRALSLTFILSASALLFSFPNLSDDIYRFYWDADLVRQGVSPYAYLPSELISTPSGIQLDADLYKLLNSKEYHSIYPPLGQLFYYIAYLLSSSWISFSICLKVLYLSVTFLGWHYTKSLISETGRDIKSAYIFFLNPLVLVEGIGNLHIEIIMVSFLALTFYQYNKRNRAAGIAANYAAAISLKLNPLLISPFFWFHQNKKWRLKVALYTGILFLILLSPIIWHSGLSGFISSIDLYFRKFEFNGGIYYIFRYLGKIYSGYNMIAHIGPLMGIIVLTCVIWKSIKREGRSLADMMHLSLWAWTLYLLFSTTVHPWYTIPLLYFSVFTGKVFPVIWSYMITWTYVNYSYDPYFENLWVVTFEYAILYILIYLECWNKELGGKIKRVLISS